ncbi:hypothetical protein llap_17411 [Limosa lapponica baueri]|uniref:Uncharacterized protein n=1 Tax=Limosa lapponica baueri TaxID=1758121 RepID=A0A2I0TES6_LIMLA|nr:hypothetical protein llap_17411 [Limosa lapponica baueri]
MLTCKATTETPGFNPHGINPFPFALQGARSGPSHPIPAKDLLRPPVPHTSSATKPLTAILTGTVSESDIRIYAERIEVKDELYQQLDLQHSELRGEKPQC